MVSMFAIRLGRSRWFLTLIFALCLGISQALNLWAIFPQYGGWSIFGFPLVFYQHQAGTQYIYFNIIFLLMDIFIWYMAARAIVFGYRKLTKYGILK